MGKDKAQHMVNQPARNVISSDSREGLVLSMCYKSEESMGWLVKGNLS